VIDHGNALLPEVNSGGSTLAVDDAGASDPPISTVSIVSIFVVSIDRKYEIDRNRSREDNRFETNSACENLRTLEAVRLQTLNRID
jgi:hypothetical protein